MVMARSLSQATRRRGAAPTPVRPTNRSGGAIASLQRVIGNRGIGTLLQAKLQISQPHDPLEQEADRVAEQVSRMPAPTTVHRKSCRECSPQAPCPTCAQENKRLIRRKTEPVSDTAGASVPDNLLQHLGPGQPLDYSARAFFEPRFGHDLSHVRIHTDPVAATSARSVNALAYTVGRDVVFSTDQYTPQTSAGRRLLAHELTHTLQQGSTPHLYRQCRDAWEAIPVPEGDSSLKADLSFDLGSIQLNDQVSVGPMAGQARVKFVLPRALQQRIAPDALGGILQRMQITIDISAHLQSAAGSAAAARFPDNELCLFVTFRQGESDSWRAHIQILSGGRLDLPVTVGAGTLVRAPPAAALGAGRATASLRLREDLTADVGEFRIGSLSDFRAVWTEILDQLKDTLQIPIRSVQVPLDARLRAGVTLPLPISSGAEGAGGVLPISTTGDVRLRTELSSEQERFRLRLSGTTAGTAVGGLVSLELWGRGSLHGPIPPVIRLGDLSTEFFADLLAQSEGGGEINGRFRAFGIPGRLDADFRLSEGRLVGDASFLSPVGIGGGAFRYGLNEGLSANLGMLGLVNLTTAPAEEEIRTRARRGIGPQPYEFGTSATGLGVTGVAVRPGSLTTLSAGVGLQSITTPRGESIYGIYGGIDLIVRF